MLLTTEAFFWHQEPWRLIEAYKGQLPPAISLSGGVGLGKREFARTLAQLILCPQALKHAAPATLAEPTAAPTCLACRLSESNTNPDFLVIGDDETNKQISVEAIAGLREFLQTTSHLGGAKVVVIQQAENMNRNSANALLKILEEPPPQKHLILTLSKPELLPPTIMSRCIKVPFSPPAPEPLKAWLAAKFPAINQAELDFLLALKGESPLAICALVENGKGALLLRLSKLVARVTAQQQDLGESLGDYKDLDNLEILDLLIWHIELRLSNAVAAPEPLSWQQTKAFFAYRSLLLSRRALLLGKFSLNRELLLNECLAPLASLV